MTPECCTHWGWGLIVSLTGGRGENILTSLEVGGGGTGAMMEARSRGGRAGSERPCTGRTAELVGRLGSGAPRPGGGWDVAVVAEKRVRLGFVVIGVPSSSSKVGGGGVLGREP